MISTPALEAVGLSVSFGPFNAVKEVSVRLWSGRRYALIGPNGAGKTTFLNALSGRQKVSRGQVLLGGKDVTSLPAHRRLGCGLGRSFQIVSIFEELTVEDNLRLALQAAMLGSRQPWLRFVSVDRKLQEMAQRLLEDTELVPVAGKVAGTLSHGHQRSLEVALAIAAGPQVLLLDEPLAGVGHSRIADTMRVIDRAAAGRTVLMVEHNLDAVMRFADEILVLDAGALIAQATPAAIQADPAVRRAYLGE